jgi:hypothetical protein
VQSHQIIFFVWVDNLQKNYPAPISTATVQLPSCGKSMKYFLDQNYYGTIVSDRVVLANAIGSVTA